MPHQHYENLREFYNATASRFHETRKKHRPEFEFLMQEINNFPAEKINIVELGCGDGRFWGYIKEHTDKKINYTGVDFSAGLIKIAKKNYPKVKFIVEDMIAYLETLPQQSVDMIIGIASIQHLMSQKQRNIFMKHVYRVLTYEGKLVMINWSFSWWFIKKHRKAILKALRNSLIPTFHTQRNDILVPWKEGNITHERFYHLFTLEELELLASHHGMVVKKLQYIDQAGKLSTQRRGARNSLAVFEKNVFSE